MIKFKKINIVLFVLLWSMFGLGQEKAQTDNINVSKDSINNAVLQQYNQKLAEIEKLRVADSLKKVELENQLSSLKTTDNLQKDELQKQLQSIRDNENQRLLDKKARINSLRATAKGFPVLGVLKDTLFYVYSKIGASTPLDRTKNIEKKINTLYENDFFKADSLSAVKSENTIDIIYGESIIMSISETDALWYNKNMVDLSGEFKTIIQNSILSAKKENSLSKILLRIGLVILVVTLAWFFLRLIGRGYKRLLDYLMLKKDTWLKSLSYKEYTFLTADQEMQVVLFALKLLRWFIYALLVYITLPIIFSIFPFSRTWADALFQLIWSPFKVVLIAIWAYLPNLFSILVIYFVMKYVIQFVKYIFAEIDSGKLKLSGFYSDWAMPTYSIVKFLLYAFMFVLIFPYLPGSDSDIFKGVSVFIGVLFSLGSSTAIANMVAGLVITYMRPFKLNDRIKIGDITGDVIEKTLLVTRIRTIKNEEITIPNSSVLSGNTTNYSTIAASEGLILHTTITIGYDVPWKDVHQSLQKAADRTPMLLKEPAPFVFQTSLDDFYVAYQINAYTKEASKQGVIYSTLHQNIQDCCNEAGIEILSPHYHAARDGNMITIPGNYLPKDYKVPSFNVNVKKGSD
ncbi:MAG: small-conductance mechanosensitive channel [Sediminicola sp.]|jgi:small-conductance mechanosensitive channel